MLLGMKSPSPDMIAEARVAALSLDLDILA